MSDISGKTVYMVSTGEYSSFEYVAAFSRRIAAEAFAASLPKDHLAEVYEWVIDDFLAERRGSAFYEVVITSTGDVEECKRVPKSEAGDTRISPFSKVYGGRFLVRCWAKNKRHAAKVAMEQVMLHQAQSS